LGKIQCPTLILASDDEGFSFAHITSMYEAIALGQLAIIPGTSHYVIKEKPELTQAIIKDFLANLVPPVTRQPVRRKRP
jgi:pimeloyl-ACP methyl ester carboxylesterase